MGHPIAQAVTLAKALNHLARCAIDNVLIHFLPLKGYGPLFIRSRNIQLSSSRYREYGNFGQVRIKW